MKKSLLLCVTCIAITFLFITSCKNFGPEVPDAESAALFAKLNGYWLEQNSTTFSTLEEAKQYASTFEIDSTEHGTVYSYIQNENNYYLREKDYCSYDIMQSVIVSNSGELTFHKKNGNLIQIVEYYKGFSDVTIQKYKSETLVEINNDTYIYSKKKSSTSDEVMYGVRFRVTDPWLMYKDIYETLSPILDKSTFVLKQKTIYSVLNGEIISDEEFIDNHIAIKIEYKFYTLYGITRFSDYMIFGTYTKEDGFLRNKEMHSSTAVFGYYTYGVSENLYITELRYPHDYTRCRIEHLTSEEVILDCEIKSDSTIKTKLCFSVVE